MLCPRYHKHEHREGAKHTGRLAVIVFHRLIALMITGSDLQTRSSRRDQGQRDNRL